MKIKFNEREVEVSKKETVFGIKDRLKNYGDIIILNGFPISADCVLSEGDVVSVIKRGEKLSKEELKAVMMARHTPFVYEKLEKSTVAVAGLGGLGSNIAISLARIGVGKLIIIDFDVVEPSNLNRQNYYLEHLGMYKVDATKEILEKVNPFIEVECHNQYLKEENIENLISDADVVIEAFDKAECKAMIANIVLTKCREKFFIGSSGMAGYFSSNTIKTRKITNKFYLCGDEENEAKVGSGLMAPRVCIAANHMANMALRILCGEYSI